MESNYNFGELSGADVRLPKLQHNQETASIQQNISLFVEVMDSLKSDEDVKQNELLKEIYFGQFNGMQDKITLLINNYQDNEEELANLLDLHDWMEGVLGQYLRRAGTPPVIQSHHNPIVYNPEAKISVLEQVESSEDLDGTTDGSSDASDSDNDSYSESEGNDRLARKRSLTGSKKDGKGKTKVQGVALVSFAEEMVHVPPKPPLPRAGYKRAEAPGECPICCEDSVSPSDLFIFDTCEHQYCRECLQGYFANCIAEGKALEITCPYPNCKTLVEYTQVQSVVTEELFNKYIEFTFIASLNADPSVKWCPRPGCGNAIIGDPENPRCQCTNSECRYEFCFLCSEPWHEMTCEQYQEWKVESGLVDTKFSNWAKKNTKKCPQCKTMIEKIAGCNHMTCSSCKFEFCWLCGGKYSSNHFDVFNVLGCPGMQSGSKQFGVARRIGMRALIGTGLVIGGILGTALAIPAAVVAGPIYGGYKLHQRRKRNSRRRRHYNW